MESGKTIIEIKGIKMEVDLTTARKVEEYRVGDCVKVLVKTYNGYESFPGAIIGFDPFQNLPTILIAYVKQGYQEAPMTVIAFNAQTENIELCPANRDELLLDKAGILKLMDREIQRKEDELGDLRRKKEYFTSRFSVYFKDAEEAFQRAMGETKA